MTQGPAERSTVSAPRTIGARDLRGLEPFRRLHGRNRTKADLLVYRIGGRTIAVKTYRARPWWIRQLLGRRSVRREVAAYRAASGVPGLPPFHGRLDAFAFAIDWIDAQPLSEFDRSAVEPAWLDAVREIVEGLHHAGVALGDLHHRDVLIDNAGRPHVVDLATAWVCPATRGGWRRAVFERLSELDLLAVARMKARAEGRDPDEEVARIGGRAARWHRRGRGVKRWLDRLRRR